jgi:acyl carrier protein
MLSADAFVTYMVDVLLLPERPSMSSRLLEDLALDSLAVYELLIAVEELGVEVNEEVWVESATVEDCYRSYIAAMNVRK